MAPTTRTPRQQIFRKLEQAFERAKQALQKESSDRDFEDLDAILLLARDTADALRTYQVRRDLLVRIYALLVSEPVDLSKLDTNWDAQATLPSIELHRHLGAIAATVANRLSDDGGMIEDPFEGVKTTCAALRSTFILHTQALGLHHAAQAFATT